MKKNLQTLSILLSVVLALTGCSLKQASNANESTNDIITPITIEDLTDSIDLDEPPMPADDESETPIDNDTLESTGEISELFSLARKYYLTVIPDGNNYVEIDCDEFQGTFTYCAGTVGIQLIYLTSDEDCFVMSMSDERNSLGIDCVLVYDDNTKFSVNSYYEDLDSFQAILESIMAMDGKEYQVGYDSALENHSNEISDDLRTLATRMSYMINQTFGSAGIIFESYGYDFSDFVHDDISTKLSKEQDL